MVGYDTLINVMQGAVVGIGFSVLGYLKNTPKPDTTFDGTTFLEDVFSGAVAGGFLGFSGISVDVTTWSATLLTVGSYGGLTVIIERLAKTIWGHIGNYFKAQATPVETPVPA